MTRKGHRTVAPEGAYSSVVAWQSREHWLTFIVPAMLALHADKLHRRVSKSLLTRYLTVRSGYANPTTGRRCIVRPDTIASVLGVTKRQVQLCALVAREIGLEVVIQTGRMLTMEERWPLIRAGSRQRGLSTEVAFTIPRATVRTLGIFTPPGGPSFGGKHHSRTTHLPHDKPTASGRKKDAASRRPPRQEGRRWIAARRLAVEVAQIVPWCRSEAISRLSPALMRFATATAPWEATDVVIALRGSAGRRGQNFDELTLDRIRTRPAALLAGLLRDLDVVADHPRQLELEEAAIPEHDCDHGWITVRDAEGREAGLTRCAGGPACARAHARRAEEH
ncbi:hypothetical protein GCM10027579_13390 [Calidifontibacter terrae]